MKSNSARFSPGRLVRLSAMIAFVVGVFLVPVSAQSKTIQPESHQPSTPAPGTMPRLTPNTSSPVHLSLVGYDCCGSEEFEHIHVCDSSASNTDISGWKIYSPYTGDTFTFPSNIQAKDCASDRPAVNTYYTGNVDNVTVFCWCWTWPDPARTHDEWPDGVGVTYRAYLYDASNNLINTCYYTPQGPSIDGGNAKCMYYLTLLPLVQQ